MVITDTHWFSFSQMTMVPLIPTLSTNRAQATWLSLQSTCSDLADVFVDDANDLKRQRAPESTIPEGRGNAGKEDREKKNRRL